ncbi:MAG: hypothetical protein FWB71_03985 [Defluviitaleaceae bacterium]|nr:hypothetical protein [Defluviitaleaceae bacterium]
MEKRRDGNMIGIPMGFEGFYAGDLTMHYMFYPTFVPLIDEEPAPRPAFTDSLQADLTLGIEPDAFV